MKPFNLAALCGALIGMYVLGIGPAIWLLDNPATPAWVQVSLVWFYMPLETAGRSIPWVGRLLAWYVRLFVG